MGTEARGGGSFNRVIEELFKFAKTELFQPIRHSIMGPVGPVYTVLSVDGVALPQPTILSGFDEGFYEAASRDWEQRYARIRATAS